MSKERGLTVNIKTSGYGKRDILSDIVFDVEPGSIVVLVGPNGSGKSTVIKTIAGELKYTGEITINGRNIKDLSGIELARRLSVMMTDKRGVELTDVREMVSMGRYPYTGRFGVLREDDLKAVDEALSIVSAADIADKPFGELSDGQKQRVLLARAIAQEPEVLILDEPTSYLDIRYRLMFFSAIKRLVKEKTPAILIAMHELDELHGFADKVVCIKDGRIRNMGAPGKLLDPEHIKELYDIEDELWEEYKEFKSL